MKNYIELKIPVQRNAQWYRELCDAMQEEHIPVRWQNGFYHITVAFVHDDIHVDIIVVPKIRTDLQM